jgi:serine/threonine-protein kinase
MIEEIDRLTTALADRYRIERELGAGSMGTVYLAHDLKHERDVAIKVMSPDVAQSVGAKRFLREIRLAAKLSHPHILPLHDSGDTAGFLYYVMPNVNGESLRDRLTREAKLPIADAVRITQEVAGALDYAHRHGVVHRDIKPENVMLHEAHAMVSDFGIGKAMGAVNAMDGETETQPGIAMGTPAYMSPEQAADERLDGRSDIYSLGCVLYEMLTGEQPFIGFSVQAVIAKRFVQTPADVSALREGVSRVISRAVHRALARTPIDRFETAAQFATALGEVEAVESRPSAPEKSIAVLPFTNMSADEENDYFTDGITEDLLNMLAQVPDLRVASYASAFSFKGKNQNLRTIGEKLNVRSVLEGSVRRAGKRVRITAQLVDVVDGYHLWSERYDREIEDVFAVQDEIATAIANRLKTTLHSGWSVARKQRETESIEAYGAYLKGRALLYRRAAVEDAMQLMRRATELDPEYALAWAGLAEGYCLLGYYGGLPPEICSSRARAASQKALLFAPELPETNYANGQVQLLFEWDWAAAGRSFERALQLNPGYPEARGWYGLFYLGFVCGRWEEAYAVGDRLQRENPLSPFAALVHSAICACGVAKQQAVHWAQRAVEFDPTSFLPRWGLQNALYATGAMEECIAASPPALMIGGRTSLALMNLAIANVNLDRVPVARSVFQELEARATAEYVSPLMRAFIAAAIGERAAAVALARESFARRDPMIPAFGHSMPQGRALRMLPEFEEILTAIQLPAFMKPPA